MTHFLHTEADLQAGLAQLIIADPRLKPVAEKAGALSLRRREPGFPGLCAIVCGQQLSTASAAAIRARLFAAFDPFHHDAVRRARADKLRRLGLSAPKIKSIREIGKAVAKGRIDLTAVGDMDADEAHATLTALHGVGPWTADIYLLFCLGHADAFPAGDLAVRNPRAWLSVCANARMPRRSPKSPKSWRPWRGVAAHLLWAYYHVVKKRDVAPVQPNGRPNEAGKKQRKGKRKEWLNLTARGLSRARATRANGGFSPRLRRRRQRPDRDRARLAGLVAGRRVCSPHAPRPCGQAPVGPRVVSADVPRSGRALDRRQRGSAPTLNASSMPSSSGAICRRRRWRWSASARAR